MVYSSVLIVQCERGATEQSLFVIVHWQQGSKSLARKKAACTIRKKSKLGIMYLLKYHLKQHIIIKKGKIF